MESLSRDRPDAPLEQLAGSTPLLASRYRTTNATWLLRPWKFHRSGFGPGPSSVGRSHELPEPSAILFLTLGVDGVETSHLSTSTRTYTPTLHSFTYPPPTRTYPLLTTSPTHTYPPMPSCFWTTTEQRRRGPSRSSSTAMGTPNLVSGATYLHLPAHARNALCFGTAPWAQLGHQSTFRFCTHSFI